MTRSVSQNSLNTIFRNFKLFRDFGHAHTIIEVIDNRVDRHPRTAQHRGTALGLTSTKGHSGQSMFSSAAMTASLTP